MAERKVLTIESSYCENWTIQDAIREIIQNGLDTGTEVSIKPCVLDADGKEKWAVSDSGLGIKLSDFIIGRSSKRGNNSVIGQFGEGLKIGCLVLAREGRQVSILSLGKRYDFSIQWDETWQDRLLTIDIDDAPTERVGTTVILECSANEITQAQRLFLKLNPQPVIDKLPSIGAEIISTNPGVIWVNGLAVTKLEALYGYNFNRKELVNRDRSAISHGAVRSCITEALSTTTNKDIIQNILNKALAYKGGDVPVEINVTFNPRKNTWLKVIREMFGTKVCLSSHSVKIDLVATEKNWSVLELPWELWYSLTKILPKADAVIKDTKKIIPYSRLSASQKEFFDMGKRVANEIAGEAGLKTYPVKVFIDTEKKEGTRLFNFNQTGYYLNGVAGVCLETLQNQDLGKFVGTVLHEYVHGNGGHEDNSRSFENDLTDVIATLGLRLITEKRKVCQNRGLNYGLRKDLTS